MLELLTAYFDKTKKKIKESKIISKYVKNSLMKRYVDGEIKKASLKEIIKRIDDEED